MFDIFIVGCGGIGSLIAKQWQQRGADISALARSEISTSSLTLLAITPAAGNLDKPETLLNLPINKKWVYYFAPPPTTGSTDPRMQAFISALQSNPGRPLGIVYISTSGVYGDRQGAWVDEEAKPAPVTDRARRRLDAEQQLRVWGRSSGVPIIILRVGGIYGPGRLPLKRLQRAEPVLHPDQSPYSNRIHADDLVQTCLAAVERGVADTLYNVCDDAPSTMTDYFFTIADAVGLPRPPTITLQQAREIVTPTMLSYLTESRRLVNRRLHDELQVTLHYPDLSSGLKFATTRGADE